MFRNKGIYKECIASADWLECIWPTDLKASGTEWTAMVLKMTYKGVILPNIFLFPLFTQNQDQNST